MSYCECGAHYMQNCSWWCGRGLTNEQIWEAENPQASELRKLMSEVKELKDLLKNKTKDEK